MHSSRLAFVLLPAWAFLAIVPLAPANPAPPGQTQSKDAEYYFDQGRVAAKNLENEKAAENFRKAAELGHAKAQNNYASMLYNGVGLAKNEKEAVLWFRKAAENGAELAQLTLGRIYERGEAEQMKDPAQALLWFEKAANQGSSEAQFQVATLYYFGDTPVKQDYAKAFLWTEKAARTQHSGAENMMGSLKEDGLGCSKNMEEALSWYRKAAEQGNAKAQSNLGRIYLQGHEGKASVEKAYPWLAKSAAQMEVTAIKMLEELLKFEKLNPQQKAQTEKLIAAHDAYVTKAFTDQLNQKTGQNVRP